MTPPPSSPLLMVGCGMMGSALLTRLASGSQGPLGDISSVDVIDPHPAPIQNTGLSIGFYPSLEAYSPKKLPETLLFAVKPQQLAAILPNYGAFMARNAPLLLSIAAGTPISLFETHFPASAVIRAMPNSPARIGEGITALVANAKADAAARGEASALFSLLGQVCWLEEEADLHAVTALSGSGPAYTFLFLEALTQAGLRMGLTESLARRLATATLRGSAGLAEAFPERSLEVLRQEVVSPGGTTEAALTALLPSLPALVEDAMKRAEARSRELAKTTQT